jgi:hypothetical protein
MNAFFHAIEASQPVIGFQALSNRKIGQKTAYSALFPANFRPNFQT